MVVAIVDNDGDNVDAAIVSVADVDKLIFNDEAFVFLAVAVDAEK